MKQMDLGNEMKVKQKQKQKSCIIFSRMEEMM